MAMLDSTKAPPFFLMWREGGRQPVFKHPTEGRASAEAERLTLECPGERFYVLAPILSVVRGRVERQRYDLSDDGIPF